MSHCPFRLGATSYVVPAELVANAHYLADKVDDMQLVLFDLDDGPSNLPSPEAVAQLRRVADSRGLTYTVHLPLDLRLGDDGEETHPSLLKARKVIDCTRALNPLAYVAHLDGRRVKDSATAEQMDRWRGHSARALEIVSEWIGGHERLAVENLDTYPPDFFLPIIERLPVSRCVDVGHLWLDRHDPLPHLRDALPRARVVHLHGIAPSGRDHSSLAHTPPEKLDAVIELLLRENYCGVLTLEVFGEEDFAASMAAFEQSMERIHPTGAKTQAAKSFSL
ncbi:MAG: sugar phosphate isomerase/epimerase [Chloroflexi bacterium]|nr:sugar phosphate isomerase/epimerase [Chloroflexota bacterium]